MEVTNKVKHILFTFALISLLFSPSPSRAQTPTPPASEQNTLLDSISSFASTVITLNNPVQLDMPRRGFGPGEKPAFNLDIPIKTTSDVGKTRQANWKTSDEDIAVIITEKETAATVSAVIKKNAAGEFEILAEKGPDWVPGTYTLQITAKESFIYTRNLTQDFSWGVLAFNTHKDAYTPNETAQLSFGILDSTGSTLCDAGLSLTVRAPDGSTTVLSRDNNGIRKSGHCQGDTVTPEADYLGEYRFGAVGLYQFELTGTNDKGSHTISDVIEVTPTIPYEIDRSSFPTRVFPLEPYRVELKITANQDYRGPVRDFVPRSFYIEDISNNGTTDVRELTPLELSNEEKTRIEEAYAKYENKTKLFLDETSFEPSKVDKTPVPITWEVDWQAGQTYTLAYTIHFPTISPEFFVLGPLEMSDYKEGRQWQIANDLTCTWQAGSAGNWSTTGNWSCGRVPNSSDTAVFNGTSTQNASIDTAVNTRSISMNSGYTGTITQSGTNTITLAGNTTGFVVAAGTFSGGTGDISLNTSGANFNQSGGTFTSTSGTLNLVNNFTISAGTFNHNNGTITWNDNGDDGYTITVGTRTFYNYGMQNTCGGTFTHASGTAITVANTFQVGGTCTGYSGTFNGPGTIAVTGSTLTAYGQGAIGDIVVTVNGTGTQTLAGEADTDTYFPGLTVNKTSGTFALTNSIFVAGGAVWTYTQGTTDFTGSTVGFEENMTIAGDWVFNNVRFANGTYNSGRTINSGTDITVNGTAYFDPGAGQDFVDFYGTGGTIHAKGDIYFSESGIRDSSTVLYIDGTGAQLLDGETDNDTTIIPVVINKPSGTLTITDTFDTPNDWTYQQGTVDASASTIIFFENLTISGTHTLGNIFFCPSNFDTITIDSGTTLTASGDVELETDSFTCNQTGTSMSLNGPGTLAVQGDLTTGDSGMNGNVPITFTGSGTQTWTITSGDGFPDGTITINKSGGSVTPGAAILLDATGQDFTVQNGTLNLGNTALTVDDLFTVQSGGTVVLSGDQTISTGTTLFSGSAEYTGTGTYSSLAFGNTYGNLTISGNGSYSPSGSMTITGSYTQSTGTFNAPSSMRIGNDMIRSGGTFAVGSNTIIFDDASQTSNIDGGFSFYNLTVITPDKALVFDDADTFTVTNALTMRGTTADPVDIRSDSPGNQVDFNVSSSSPSVQGVKATDINSCGGNTITALNSASGGNVDCWQFQAQNWYNTSWPQRTRIRIFKEKVTDGPHTDFPVLVQTTSDSGLASYAQDDGDDIVFTSEDAITPLDYELVSFNGTTGAMVAWVKVPVLSSTNDTILWMYYGNSAVSAQEDPTNVWTNSYNAVWHMEESPTAGNNEIQDSTANNRDGSAESGLDGTNLITGVIGSGLDFEATSNQLVRVPNGAGLNNVSTGTISTWVRWNASGQNSAYPGNKYGAIMAREQNGVFGNNIIAIDASNPASGKVTWTHQDSNNKDITGNTNVGTGTWRYVVVSFTSGSHVLYMDGVQVGTSSTTGSNNNNSAIDFTFGGWEGQGTPDVTMDELRLSSTNRSAGWVATEYRNMTDNNFLTVDGTTQAIPRVNIQGGVHIYGGSKLKN